jgi:AcrR family transcriptional regulator
MFLTQLMTPITRSRGIRTQAERRAQTRGALLESAARGLSRHGYGNLKLEAVAREAGYTRGALYHQFRDKEDLALAAIEWVNESWADEVGAPAAEAADPVSELIMLARGHAVFCRRDVARFAMALRIEFSTQDHPVGRRLEGIHESLVKRVTRLINSGRQARTIPSGPPARTVAAALVGGLEGAVIGVARQPAHDEVLAERVVLGAVGVAPRT